MKIKKEHKDRMIGGVISLILLGLALWIKSYFKEPQMPTTSINSNDSSSQKNQINNNSGDVINNNDSRKIESSIIDKPVNVNANNAKFVNVNGKNNTYNQTINEAPQRDIIDDDLNRIKSIPKDYSIWIMVPVNNTECQKYAEYVLSACRVLGYNSNGFGGHISNYYSNKRFEIILEDSVKNAIISINPLSE